MLYFSKKNVKFMHVVNDYIYKNKNKKLYLLIFKIFNHFKTDNIYFLNLII